MKKVLAFTLIAAMSMSLFALDIFNYVPVSGNVKSYTRTDYTITSKFGELFRTPNTKIITNIDDNGNVAEIIEATAKDVVINKTLYKYNEDGNQTEEACYDANSNLLWKTVITYKDGKKVDSSEYGKNGALRGKIVYAYDGDRLVEETGYDDEGYLVWKTVNKYEAGKLVIVSQYASDGSLDTEDTYTYTENNKIESITSADLWNKTSTKKVFRYASNGNLTEITTYNNAKQITNRLVVKYDNLGNVARLSDYTITEKFGSVQNELTALADFIYSDTVAEIEVKKPRTIDAK